MKPSTRNFDAGKIDLKGYALIEASAGTGKTFSITSLYLRLILEKGLEPGNILVVTYTKAATEDLRHKIRQRLTDTIAFLEDPEGVQPDAFTRELVERLKGRGISEKKLMSRLRHGITSLDEGAIFTIHGFCQRMLKEFAFESSAPFEVEIVSNEDDIRLEGCKEFVRRRFYSGAHKLLVRWCLSLFPGQDLSRGLFERLSPLMSMPKADIEPKVSVSEVMEENRLLDEGLKGIADSLDEVFLAAWDLIEASKDAYLDKLKDSRLPEDVFSHLENRLQEALKSLYDTSILKGALREFSEGKIEAFEVEPELQYLNITSLFSGEFLLEALGRVMNHFSHPSAKESKKRVLDFQDYIKEVAQRFLASFIEDACSECGLRLLENSSFIRLNELLTDFGGLNSRFEAAFLSEARDFVEGFVQDFKSRHSVISYDDMLILLHKALKKEGSSLAHKLRKRFPVALIDEFQDTDSIQWEIFSSIYPDPETSPLFLIGDPKQAIYGFRGADIFTYILAKKTVLPDRHYNLETNWRSTPGVLKAINALFHDEPADEEGTGTFILPEIRYYPVNSRPDPPGDLVIESDRKSVEIWLGQDGDENEKEKAGSDKGKRGLENLGLPHEAVLTAKEISRLICLGREGKAYFQDEKGKTGEKRPVSAGDITILVRDFIEASMVREALYEENIPCVYYGPGSVFETNEAFEMLCILKAVANPANPAALTTAMATVSFGLQGNEIMELKHDQASWDALVDEFEQLRDIWLSKGVFPMLMSLFARFDIPRKVLAIKNGERILTNMRHLAELLAQAEREQPGPERLIHWLSFCRKNPNKRAEEQQLRLETDENLVKIMSYHRSKGLEFPILFLPFIHRLAPKKGNKPQLKYFDKERSKYICILAPKRGGDEKLKRLHSAILELSDFLSEKGHRARGRESIKDVIEGLIEPQREHHKEAIKEQQLAEIVRLGYVAFTRAKQKLYFYLPERSLPAFLNGPSFSRDSESKTKEEDPRFQTLSSLSSVRTIEAFAKYEECKNFSIQGEHEKEEGPFEVPQVHRSPLAPWTWRPLSFSSIVRSAHDDEHVAWLADLPVDEAGLSLDSSPEKTVFTFPKGPRAGECIHALLEQIDFRWEGERIHEQALKVLSRYGIEEGWGRVLTEIALNTLHSSLGEGIRLKELEPKWISKEMAFSMDLSRELLPQDIQGVEQVERGVLKGFIDLAFRHGDTFYIVDYKSNWLGPGPESYTREEIVKVMDHHSYWLQAAIYVKALESFLGRYSDVSRVGGAFYLFVRGMNPKWEGGHGTIFVSRDELKGMFPALWGKDVCVRK